MKFFRELMDNAARVNNQSTTPAMPLIESLESRQLLSAACPETLLLSAPLQSDIASPAILSAAEAIAQPAPKAAAPSILGNFVGTYRDSEGYVAQVILKVTSQRSTTIQGRLYSGDLGGFDVTGSGTYTSKGVILGVGGKSDTLSKGTVKARVSADGKTLTGTLSAYVMGFFSQGSLELTKATKRVPNKLTAKCPSLLGNYAGTISQYGYSEKISSSITKQQGGNLWGKGAGADGRSIPFTGTVLADGRFRIIGNGNGITLEMYGVVRKGGILEGYTTITEDGETNTFNFSMKRR